MGQVAGEGGAEACVRPGGNENDAKNGRRSTVAVFDQLFGLPTPSLLRRVTKRTRKRGCLLHWAVEARSMRQPQKGEDQSEKGGGSIGTMYEGWIAGGNWWSTRFFRHQSLGNLN